MEDKTVLGVFDSGVGGLTVLRRLLGRGCFERVIYLGDTARVPYGTRSFETVRRFAADDVEFLISCGATEIVAACGTVSAIALDDLRTRFDVPITGVIDAAVRGSIRETVNGRIGVIGTSATVRSGVYERKILSEDRKFKVTSVACPLLVPLAENGFAERPDGEEIVRRTCELYLAPLREAGIDTLIMGCTHFPLFAKYFDEVLGGRVKLVDCGAELAAEFPRGGCTDPELEVLVTDGAESFSAVSQHFCGCDFLPDARRVTLNAR